mgnify:CR=1 FL=1
MTVHYEWDVELVRTYADGDNDVVDHNFFSTYLGCKWYVNKKKLDPSYSLEIVLVCDDDNGRSWAYMEDGKLPEYFQDAYQNDVCKVPVRFHNEVLKG